MPVPVASTHQNGAGLKAAKFEQMDTAGPFARLQGGSANADKAEQSSSIADQEHLAEADSAMQSNDSRRASPWALETEGLCFTYPGIDGRPLPGARSVVQDMSVQLSPGSRCLLIGPNGAGKTSLLRILAGKHKVPEDCVSVLGRPPFYDTLLTTSGDVAYIGGNWDRDIAFAGYAVPLQGGFSAGKMIENVQGVSEDRRQRLLKVLDIDPEWRMNKVSDGQRRRVQICMGLLRPFKVLLLDEVTVDLDVLGRSDLMEFLRSECESVGATIVYATHIFDGLEDWPTHLMYLANGRLQEFAPATDFPELEQGQLLSLVERWLRAEKLERQKRNADKPEASPKTDKTALPEWNNGWAPGRLASSIKHASNAVMRM